MSHLLDGGSGASNTWTQGADVTTAAGTFHSYTYSGDSSLQVLIDNHIASVTLS